MSDAAEFFTPGDLALNPVPEPEFFTVGDAAKVLRVGPDRVRDFERNGQLPAQRTNGGVRLFRKSDVLRLAAEREQRRSQ
jgi:excisionase family DNA binding protein